MLSRLHLILPALVLFGFAGWLFSDETSSPDLSSGIRSLQQSLQELQKQIKELQSSVKDLARAARTIRESRRVTPPAVSAPPNTVPPLVRAQEAYDRGR